MEVIEKDLENKILEISVGNNTILVQLYNQYSILLTEFGEPSPKKQHVESQRMESKGQGIE